MSCVKVPPLMLAAAGLAAWRLDRDAARAAANGRTLLAEIVAAPLCRGEAAVGGSGMR